MHSFSLLPPGAVEEYNNVAIANIIICFVCILILLISSKINKKRCAVWFTAKFCYYICFIYLVAHFFLYVFSNPVSAVLIWTLVNLKRCYIVVTLPIERERHYHSVCCTDWWSPSLAAIFTFILPIYSLRQLKYYRSKGQENIQSIVLMESRGVTGTQNYQHITTKLW
ncbi:hypothetical protein DICVIV_13309 [Dictyocaulus viviparus]|uniref:Uncharacterized protein n=1 Tax=Dictyocaulus viviparus TaxID=29172 RepID=A0A0D8XE96_DICVI|nr:hypothetical protein DICVIV_13309 [Dictyocaulus viviparus]